jgi:hypothetical protein
MIPLEAIFGGLTGFVSSLATGIMNYKMKKLELKTLGIKNEHEIRRIEAEANVMKLEKEMEIAIVDTTYRGEENIEDAKTFGKVQEDMNKNANRIYDTVDTLLKTSGKFDFVFRFLGGVLAFLLGIVEIVQKSIRPGLTIFYTASSVYIFYVCINIMDKNNQILDIKQSFYIIDQCISAVIYLTISIVTFWFSDRTAGKFIRNHLEKTSLKK